MNRNYSALGRMVLLLGILALPLAACADAPRPSETSLAPDGACRPGMTLKPGESCIHAFSNPADLGSAATGTSAGSEQLTRRFRVGPDGTGYYGDLAAGQRIDHAEGEGAELVAFSG